MRVLKVSYFAAFREATGVSSERVDSAAATVAALFDECAGRHPGLHRYTASLVAVNDEMTAWDAALADGDEVLFFPPVAGG
jgi:molybdopterin converting factor subunit 1